MATAIHIPPPEKVPRLRPPKGFALRTLSAVASCRLRAQKTRSLRRAGIEPAAPVLLSCYL